MKFKIITLGCKVNQYESNFMEESLIKSDFVLVDEEKDADIIIINTCSVTDMSDKKSLKMVRHMKRENPEAILVVCGCSTQNDDSKYSDLGINIMLGNKDKSKIVELLKNYIDTKENYFGITKERKLPFEDMHINNFNQVRAYIKVQDGCNNFCSYCIIPYVRGDIRSKNFDETIKEVNTLVNNGYKEIVLTGIHTGSYNDSGKDLTDLINEMSKIEGLERIRLSSVEITELNDKFLDMLKTNKKFCKHLHVPLQAGSDEILKVMNRKYDLKYFEEKINKIRSIIPDISITTDVIVGHNFETEELFEKTLEFCEKIKFAKIHVFPYSERKKTASSYMKGKVDMGERRNRARRLITLSEKLEKEYYDKFIGQKLDVLVEEVKDGISIGHTSNYLKVEIPEVLEVGQIYQREIK